MRRPLAPHLPHAAALLAALLCGPVAGRADPAMECGLDASSQVEIAACVADMERRVEHAVDLSYGFAADASRALDETTGRALALPALIRAQVAWTAWREAHCDQVGASFGGGGGSGIAVRGCRVELGRARAAQLLEMAR